ncbi:MAG: PepSY domain-containing protein, partial [Kordiimonas sp.]
MLKGYIAFHKNVALIMGVWLLLLIFSGIILVFKSDIFAIYTLLKSPPHHSAVIPVIEDIYNQYSPGCNNLRVDQYNSIFSESPAFSVRCDSKGDFLTVTGPAVPGSKDVMLVFRTIFEFHYDLLVPSGRFLQAVAGILLLSMSVTGFVIWSRMPGRFWKKATFRLSQSMPKSGKHFQIHRAVGIWVAILALTVVLFGIIMAG